MSIINFTEIPESHKATGKQDTFELFCREFIETVLNFKIIEGPDRGQDGGRDLIVAEKQSGVISTSEKRWLVSCKHKAHSKSTVLESDEQNIVDRVRAFDCDGFMGFYSTNISAPFARRIDQLQRANKIEFAVLDNERIERMILDSKPGLQLLRRFFPISYAKWQGTHETSNLLDEYMPLTCKHCGKELLKNNYLGIIVFEQSRDYDSGVETIHDFYWCCKGKCDRTLEEAVDERDHGTSWEDISDLLIPLGFLRWLMGVINGMHSGEHIWSDKTFEKLKEFIICLSQKTLRANTEEQRERFKSLLEIPDYL